MAKAKKKTAKKVARKTTRRAPVDPNLSAADMIERSLRAHEMPSPAQIEAQISAYMSAIGKKGGKASGAKRMEMPVEERRRVASIGARAMWAKKKKRPVQP